MGIQQAALLYVLLMSGMMALDNSFVRMATKTGNLMQMV